MKPVIEVKNLSKKYQISHSQKTNYHTLRDDLAAAIKKPASLITGRTQSKETFWALKDVSFEVNQGDVVGIIGKNGSGKSTLLKILSRIVDPTEGKAILRGKTASLLEVGTGFHQELTGRENIYFNGSILGMKKSEINHKLNDIIEFSEVEQFLDTPVKYYSSGMYVRLAFAVAAHLEPDILIVDEVLAVGDAAFQKKSLGKMKDVASHGRTVLFVSHNMGSVKQLCKSVILLSKGSIVETGTPEKVIAKYSSSTQPDFERGLLSTLKGKVEDIRINDSKNLHCHLDSGNDIKVNLSYTPNGKQKRVVFGLDLRSAQDGTLLALTHSALENKYFEVESQTNFMFTIKLPRIAPGEYILGLSMWADDTFALDSEPIAKIEINPLAPFASGEVFSNYSSILLVESSWEKLS